MRYVARWAVACVSILIFVLLTHRASATELVITPPRINEIYPNAPGSSELGLEFVEIYNESTTAIDLSNYEIRVKDKPKQMSLSGALEPGAYSALITPFSLVKSGENIQLVYIGTSPETIIEEVEYSSGALETQSWSYFDDGWVLAPISQGGENQRYPGEVEEPVDMCPATPEVDSEVPNGYIIDGDGNCVAVVQPTLCSNNVKLSEFLSDPVGLESDGGEFIELFNPGSVEVSLVGCRLVSSKSSQPLYEFSESDVIAPGGYYVVSLTDKLTNSSGSVTFSTFELDDVVTYSNLKEGQSMAIFNDTWEMTNQPSPMSANMRYVEPGLGGQTVSVASANFAPCEAGKYRNPETNRCKNIESADESLAPCDTGQFRNPETNRCKSSSSATSSLASCSPGQERNPETNRCRKIATTNPTLKACDKGYERNTETNRCRKVISTNAAAQLGPDEGKSSGIKLNTIAVGSFMTAALGYAAFEYRTEAMSAFRSVRSKFIKGRPPD
jgi:hypothetical protein